MALIRGGQKRDLRVDFCRGLALWWIFTDHIPGNVLANVSLRNFAMCDATEVFVLLAGYGSGLSYGATMDQRGYFLAAADTVRRAWILYIAHIFLFVVFTAQVAYSAQALDRGFYLEETRLDVLADNPYRALLHALMLSYQPNLLNILPLYVMLLLFFAVALPLLRYRWLLLGASFVLYAVARITGLNLTAWTGEGWYFDPFAWQFLFMIGAVLSYAPPDTKAWPKRLLDVLAILVLAAGLLVIWVVDTHPRIMADLPTAVIRFVITEDKTTLHPFRLLSILALAWLVVRLVPQKSAWLRSRLAGPLVLIGQNSLPVFCSGIFFGFAARLGLEFDDTAWMQIAVNVSGVAAMVTIGALAAWYRNTDRAAPPRPATLPPATLPPATLPPATLPVIAGTDTGLRG